MKDHLIIFYREKTIEVLLMLVLTLEYIGAVETECVFVLPLLTQNVPPKFQMALG